MKIKQRYFLKITKEKNKKNYQSQKLKKQRNNRANIHQ